MIRTASGSVGTEVLRQQALNDLVALIEVVAETRQGLRKYQTVLERNRRRIAQGGRASDMPTVYDVQAVRSTISDRLDNLERARNASRCSLWRLQVAEGTTLAEIARTWGLSRQLVSRALARDEAHHGRRRN
jgi:hypothetical protein